MALLGMDLGRVVLLGMDLVDQVALIGAQRERERERERENKKN